MHGWPVHGLSCVVVVVGARVDDVEVDDDVDVVGLLVVVVWAQTAPGAKCDADDERDAHTLVNRLKFPPLR